MYPLTTDVPKLVWTGTLLTVQVERYSLTRKMSCFKSDTKYRQPPVAELFKTRLRNWRISNGLIQKEAAVKLDVAVATIRKWEKGKREPKKLTMAEVERRMVGAAK